MPAISCSAPGKVILCGEHAVVYGTPAIALPVNQISTTTRIFAKPMAPANEVMLIAPAIGLDALLKSLDQHHPLRYTADQVKNSLGISSLPSCEIRISSTIPLTGGLGSSAASTVSFIRALSTFLGHPFSNELINEIAFNVEIIHHGTPSGIDNTVVTYQSAVFFQKGLPVELIKSKKEFSLVIADTGVRSSTADAVAGVRQRWSSNQSRYNQYFSRIGEISSAIKHHLQLGEIEPIGVLLTKNHEILTEMEVSTPALDQLVEIALEHGALGAKIAGAGLGGNMLALPSNGQADLLAQNLKEHGASSVIITHVSAESRSVHV